MKTKTHSFNRWFYLSVLAQLPAALRAVNEGAVYFIIGLLLIYVGALGNVMAIYFNGQKMPVKPPMQETELYAPIGHRTRLPWLCDIIEFDFKIVSGIASFGDVVLIVGMAMAFINLFFFRH